MDIWEIADKYGLPIAMLVFAVTALYFDLVVSGRRYREVRRERDQLLRLALSGLRAGERNANVAERALGVADAIARRGEDSDGDAAG